MTTKSPPPEGGGLICKNQLKGVTRCLVHNPV
nr:MAG TPA: hypothetical protein [Caudoviricetes sp.]